MLYNKYQVRKPSLETVRQNTIGYENSAKSITRHEPQVLLLGAGLPLTGAKSAGTYETHTNELLLQENKKLIWVCESIKSVLDSGRTRRWLEIKYVKCLKALELLGQEAWFTGYILREFKLERPELKY